jgi:hypothetical protein
LKKKAKQLLKTLKKQGWRDVEHSGKANPHHQFLFIIFSNNRIRVFLLEQQVNAHLSHLSSRIKVFSRIH